MAQSPAAARSGRARPWLAVGAGCAVLAVCALNASAGGAGLLYLRGRGPAPVGAPNVEYVLDASPRMLQPSADGGTRLSEAQGVLAEILRPASPAVTAGLRVFGTGQLPGTCQDTNLLVPLAPANQANISDQLTTMQGGAGVDAALGVALVAAIRDLAATRGPHALVVVTGGADSCNPQAGQLIAQEADWLHIQLQLFVVGYQVSTDDGVAIKGVVDQTSGGTYIEARTVAAPRLPAGRYDLHLSYQVAPSSPFIGGYDEQWVAGVSVAAGLTTTASYDLKLGQANLTVLEAAGKPVADGNYLFAFRIYHPDDLNYAAAWVIVTSTAALQLAPGTYQLQVDFPGTNLFRQVQSAQTFEVKAGQTLAYAFDLRLGHMRVEVDDEAGLPIDAARVNANASRLETRIRPSVFPTAPTPLTWRCKPRRSTTSC